jgi:hypothetical protein
LAKRYALPGKVRKNFKTTFGATITVMLISVLVGYSFSSFN